MTQVPVRTGLLIGMLILALPQWIVRKSFYKHFSLIQCLIKLCLLCLNLVVSIFASEIGQAREYSPSGVAETRQERQRLMEFLPKSVDELPPRRMKDSFVTAVIPLKDQWDIRERYVTLEGNVRIGRVLEDMDIFSVYCAFRHILNPRSVGKKNPYSVVTALVDSIHVANGKMRASFLYITCKNKTSTQQPLFLQNDEDVRLSGHVSYAGRSSIETSLVVDQKDENGNYQKIFDAVFLMVARDPMNTGGALVNPLVGDTDEEKRFLRLGIGTFTATSCHISCVSQANLFYSLRFI